MYLAIRTNRVIEHYRFPAIESAIESAIIAFGGEVFPKLNWSAPLDAAWMNCGSMKCRNAAEIFLLLKSSDRIAYDLDHMYELCEPSSHMIQTQYTLVIRKWANLNASQEFRVFVLNNEIVGNHYVSLYVKDQITYKYKLCFCYC